MTATCPCGKKRSLDECCGRFLNGAAHAKTAEQLMRSRYSAYALGGHGEYLLRSWFPATVGGLSVEDLDQKTFDWQGLDILNKSQEGDTATVEFKAWYQAPGAAEPSAMHEVSEFTRVKGRWYYLGGRVGGRIGGRES